MKFPVFLACLLALSCAPARAALVNRWSFNQAAGNAPAGTMLTDSVGGAVATVQGNNATFSGTGLTITGTTDGNQTAANIAGYVDLPNGLISSKTNLSVEIWAAPLSFKGNARIFEFGRNNTPGTGEVIDTMFAPGAGIGASDAVYVNFFVNSQNSQRMKAWLNGVTMTQQDTALTNSLGTFYHYVFTFQDGVGSFGAAGGRMTWYRNGTPAATADVNFRLTNIEDVNNWLGRSNFTNDSLAHATYDEFRLYNHALTPAEISANLAAGPNTIPGPPVPAPVPNHRWTFTTQAAAQAAPGTVFTDDIGAQIARLRGNGGALTGGAVVLPGTTTGNQSAATISAYLDLPNGLVSQTASVSFEAWAAPLSSKTWQRLFDFGRCVASFGNGAAAGEILDSAAAPGATTAYDNLSLTFNNAGNLNSQQLEGQFDGNPPVFTFSTAATTAGTKYHYVLVVEDTATGCQARWYRNGVLQNSNDFGFHLNQMEDVNNWIGRSMYSGDSNAHMSLDELRIYRRVITPAEILASFTAGPDPTVGPPEPPVPAPIPSRRWSFNSAAGSAPAGTAFTDDATGEIATVRGNGAMLNGTELVLPAATANGNQTAAAISAYLDLPDGLVSARPNLTFEAWLTPLSSKRWQRIFDFGNTSLTSGDGADPGEIIDGLVAPGEFISNDNLFLSLNVNDTLGTQRVEGRLAGGTATGLNTDYSAVTAVGTRYHYVLTVADGAGSSGATGCLVKWYRNGVLGGSLDLPYRLPDLRDVNNWIGRSMWAGDTNSNFELDELRIYDRAISPAEVQASTSAGPNAVFTPPVAVNDSMTMHPDQKALIDVLGNDTGGPLPGTLEILSPPATGTATLSGGKIRYAHAGGSTSPVTFTYRVGNVSGLTATGTVTVSFALSLRIANEALTMPAAPPATSWQLVDALPGLSFTRPVCLASVPGDANKLYVCEQGGVIRRVADVTSPAPTANVFLDLTTVGGGFNIGPLLAGQPENGLLGLAFHPNYATNGYFYVAYTVNLSGNYFQRVSRFSRSASDPAIANPASELILLHIDDFGLNHNGGDLHFGPYDGYLYYGTGDGENSTAGQARSQKINDDFYSGIFRIDVDKKPGSLPPNPHASIPTPGGVAGFNVPPDNPFIHPNLSPAGTWNGIYNGVNYTGSLGSVRTEFWATGIRHAWRMSFDPVTGDLWEGDVGQNTYEEINKIVKGGNYGWAYREGAHNFNGILGAAPGGFTSIDPAYEYVHSGIAGGDAQFKGNSVVGGHVYRGSRFPALVGRYIFSDSVSGHVWEMNTATGATTRLTGLPGAYGVLSTQGVDPANKDPLFAAYLNGKIMRLATGDAPNQNFPTTLSATGLFADLSDLAPAPGLLPYAPNLTFWSDHAVKRRWFAIPNGIDRMTWSRDGAWTFPAGQIWVKHFDLPLNRSNPPSPGDPVNPAKRIETRVLVRNATGIYGVSYKWNEAGTEATLAADGGENFPVNVTVNGQPYAQPWSIPSRTQCVTCHTPQAGHALSFNTRQLNLTNFINGFAGNQIDVLRSGGYFSNTTESPNVLPRHLRPDETAYPLEARVRSYLAVNCAYCHQTGGTGPSWDGRPELTLTATGLINGLATGALNGGDKLVSVTTPGNNSYDDAHSVILSRVAVTGGYTRMPPLGSNELDQTNIALLTEWIGGSALLNRQTYDQWRLAQFLSSTSPQGAATVDADGDGRINHAEFLALSGPQNSAQFLQPSLTAAGANLTFGFTVPANRSWQIETSTDLAAWSLWNVPGNSGLPAAGGPISLTAPRTGAQQFFRLRLWEN